MIDDETLDRLMDRMDEERLELLGLEDVLTGLRQGASQISTPSGDGCRISGERRHVKGVDTP